MLINGASGGVGTFAVQIAKALGAEVTAVCSTAERRTRAIDRRRPRHRLHAARTSRESDRRYDVIFDNAGSRSWWACNRMLKPRGTVVLVGGPMTSRLLGPLGHLAITKLGAWPSKRKCVFFIASFNSPDMDVVRELLETGQVTPVVERRYELSEIADALRYIGQGHAQGKIVVSL